MARSKKAPSEVEPPADIEETITDTPMVEDEPVVEEVENLDAEASTEEAEEPAVEVLAESAVPPEKNGSVLPMALGGLVAAAIGFGTSQYMGNSNWPFRSPTDATAPLVEKIDAQVAELSNVSVRVDDLSTTVEQIPNDPRFDQILTELTKSSERMDVLGQDLADMGTRISDLEGRPIPDIGATVEAVEAYEDQLTTMRGMFQDELERIKGAQDAANAMNATAQESSGSMRILNAISQVSAAVESGAGFQVPLEQLAELSVTVPQVLKDNSVNGVATLAKLTGDFPAQAREALLASIDEQSANGEISKVSAFLKSQLGVRSLEPVEGNDPDAILSRAEAAIQSGDIAETLRELSGMPESGKTKLSNWMVMAETRMNVLAGVAELSQKFAK